MKSAIHVKCGRDDRGLPNHVSPDRDHHWWSGHWDLTDETADALRGGWLYLHLTKATPSYYGGLIDGFERVTVTDVARASRVRLRFQPRLQAKGVAWRGQVHGPAWTGRLVAADLAHEAVPLAP